MLHVACRAMNVACCMMSDECCMLHFSVEVIIRKYCKKKL